MHTSTTVVLINPTVIAPVIELKPADLKFDYFKSSGPGGQAVNTASSAVRVTHLATGLSQECQKERTQHINKDIAVQKLKTRLFVLERDRILEKNQRQGKIQIGT
jgi:peptide chain release factor 2